MAAIMAAQRKRGKYRRYPYENIPTPITTLEKVLIGMVIAMILLIVGLCVFGH
jgi:hypothetical protein